MFVYLCIIICSAWLLSICFSSPLVIPTPVAAAGPVHRSIPQPKLHLGEKKAAQALESQEFQLVPSLEFQSWCSGGFLHVVQGSGAQDSSVFPQWDGLDQPCVYSQPWINLSSSMFLLIPAGSRCFSNTCFLFFFSPSTPSSCVIWSPRPALLLWQIFQLLNGRS